MTPIIIPIFLPYLGCRADCLFCNQKGTAKGFLSPPSVRNFIQSSLKRLPPDHTNREKQVAFYGGSFTALPTDDQIRYLREGKPFLTSGLIDSIRISTRPDALDEDILSLLKKYGVKTVEIGAQSMIDEVLLLSRRGHHAEDTASAIQRLKRWGFEVGLQLMIGLPGDTLDHFLHTLDHIIRLQPNFLRIHPTLVLKGAPLEILWRDKNYSPLSLEKAIEWLKKGLLKLERANIAVARIGLQPTEELERDFLAGPYHPALRQLIDSTIFLDMAKQLLQTRREESQVLFLCNPKEVSNLRGQKNENIQRLKDGFGLQEILLQTKEDMPKGTLILQTQKEEVSIHRRDLIRYEH